MIFHLVIYFFFSQTNLVFKSNPVFIDMLDSFCCSLFKFLLFDYWYSTKFEFHPVLLLFFYKYQYILTRFNILQCKVFIMSYFLVFIVYSTYSIVLNVCKQTFHISYVRISQIVKSVLMWNLQHIIFIWRPRY